MGEKSSRKFAQVKIKKNEKNHHLDVPFVRIPLFDLEGLGWARCWPFGRATPPHNSTGHGLLGFDPLPY